MRKLSDQHYPMAERITVLLDHLNTHGPASFDEAFAPHEARRLAERFEFHDTPKHGSWLNRAEIVFRVLSRQCLDRRTHNIETLRNETRAWQRERHAANKVIDWQFTPPTPGSSSNVSALSLRLDGLLGPVITCLLQKSCKPDTLSALLLFDSLWSSNT